METEYISISHWGMFSTNPNDYVPHSFWESMYNV